MLSCCILKISDPMCDLFRINQEKRAIGGQQKHTLSTLSQWFESIYGRSPCTSNKDVTSRPRTPSQNGPTCKLSPLRATYEDVTQVKTISFFLTIVSRAFYPPVYFIISYISQPNQSSSSHPGIQHNLFWMGC